MSNEAVCTQTSDKSRSTANKAIGCATCTDPGPKRGRVSWARAKITLSGVGMRGKREGEKAGTGSAPVDEARKATGRTVSLGELHSAGWGSGMKNDRW